MLMRVFACMYVGAKSYAHRLKLISVRTAAVTRTALNHGLHSHTFTQANGTQLWRNNRLILQMHIGITGETKEV